MHLQQTKVGSRGTGGPQYFFHGVPDAIKEHLRRRRACDVVLQTPYGIAGSPFRAVDKDHKLDDSGRILPGRVGKDRIQQAHGTSSIGEAIRQWYRLPQHRDFERIDVDVTIHPDGHFILAPLCVYMRGKPRGIPLERPYHPLSFTRDYQSLLWRQQIERSGERNEAELSWVSDQLRRVVADQKTTGSIAPKEEDLLRTSGALFKLGMRLSAYVGRGYDCPASSFEMLDYPSYSCPVEIKKHSRGFRYQMLRYLPLPRAVILCVHHDLMNPPDHVDVVELAALADHVQAVAEGA